MNTYEMAMYIEKYRVEAFQKYQENLGDIMEQQQVAIILNRLFVEKSSTDKKLNQSEISRRSGHSKTYVNELFSLNPEKQKKPSRDVLIKIGFAMRLSRYEIDTLLKAASYKELYPKNPRDVAIMVALERKYTLEETNDYLDENNFESLED